MSVHPADFLMSGEKYALTRKELVALSGYCDSRLRMSIGERRETEVILNLWGGKGYFKPLESDEAAVLEFYMKEHAAAVKRLARLKTARRWLELHSNYTFQDYAPEIKILAVPADEKVFICRDGKMVEVTE